MSVLRLFSTPPGYTAKAEKTSRLRRRYRLPVDFAAAWTLIDQCVVSAGNFLTGVLLARGLSEHEYGAFSVVLETMLFLNSLQSAVIVYPLTVRGAVASTSDLRRQTSAAMILTLLLLPLLGGAMGLGTLAGAGAGSNSLLVVAAISAMLLWQLQETVRRALLASFRAGECLIGDTLSYLGQALIIFILYYNQSLTLPRVFLTIGISSAIAALVQATRVGWVRLTARELLVAAKEFWSLGRWVLLSALMASVTLLSYVWILKFRGGDEPAILAAINVPLKIANPILLASGSLLVPAVARAFKYSDHRSAFRAACRAAAPGMLLLLPLYVCLFLRPDLALRLLLGAKSTYLLYAPLLRLYSVGTAILYFDFLLNAYINGLGESRINFYARLTHAIAAICISIPATALFGVQGLVVSFMATASISLIAESIALRRIIMRRRSTQAFNIDLPEPAPFARVAEPTEILQEQA